MTSFANAFGPSDFEVPNSKNGLNHHEEIDSFSNIDLDQQATPTHQPRNGSETFQMHSPLSSGPTLNTPSYNRGSSSSTKFVCLLNILL